MPRSSLVPACAGSCLILRKCWATLSAFRKAYEVCFIRFYGINLNQNVVLQQIGYDGKTGTPWERLFKVSTGGMIITALGFVPGYYASILTIEKLGRKWIQMQGFLMAALFRTPISEPVSQCLKLIIDSGYPRWQVPRSEQTGVHRLLRLPPVLLQLWS